MKSKGLALIASHERKLLDGDPAAFEAFMREHEESVFRLALRWLGSVEEARDLTQDVFLTLSRKLAQFEGGARLSTWLYRVTVNHAKNRLRYLSRRRMRAHDAYEEGQGGLAKQGAHQVFAGPHDVLVGRELSEHIDAALSRLNPLHRQILVWRDIEGISYEGIAQRLDLPEGTVKSRLHRARTQLKVLLERERQCVSEGQASLSPPDSPVIAGAR